MEERPIIFSSESIQAILEGRKTQTRRVIKPQPINSTSWTKMPEDYRWGDDCSFYPNTDNAKPKRLACPHGNPGGKLWVRETWYNSIHSDGFSEDGNEIVHDCAAYKSTGTFQCGKDDPIAYKRKYKSPIFMPRWASRITLEITDIRVERVQEITFYELQQEGMQGELTKAVKEYIRLWDSLNAKRGYPWSDNPWVWAIEFKMIEKGA